MYAAGNVGRKTMPSPFQAVNALGAGGRNDLAISHISPAVFDARSVEDIQTY